MIEVSLEKLLEVGAHFGHQAKRWNPKMAPFLYGAKDGVHVFDLVKTKEQLDKALSVISDYSSKGKVILFVATKKQAKQAVVELSKKTGCLYVNERWLGGTLTNFDQMMKSVKKLAEMKEKFARGDYNSFTKKERLLLERKMNDLEKSFGGVATIKTMPDLMVIIDIHKEKGAAIEAKALNIPTIGVVDSNSDPDLVTYPIPMNDDASKALEFVFQLFESAIIEGKNTNDVVEKPKKAKATKKEKEVKSNG